MTDNPFVADIRSQAGGLRQVLEADIAGRVGSLTAAGYDRIVLSGMGASLFALYPAWLASVRAGLPAWWMETGELLHDARDLITERTLLVLLSQSGTSAEIVALLDRLADRHPVSVLGLTNVLDSRLAQGADLVIPILSGKEYSVSTRSYVNSVAVTSIVVDTLVGRTADLEPYRRTAASLDAYFGADWDKHVAAVHAALKDVGRLLIVGRGVALGTAWQGALVIKEVAKIPVEGLSTAQFRHGPLELADSATTVIMLEGDAQTAELDRRLAGELAAFGTRVLWIGPHPPAGIGALPIAAGHDLVGNIVDVVPLEIASVVLAEAGGFTAGEFRHSADVAKSL